MIASRRSVSLSQALELAKWVFDEGTPSQQEPLRALTIQGLSYLGEELRYDRVRGQDDDADLPLLRLRCAQLAVSIAQRGFRDEPAVDLWLRISKEDPLPEVRFAVAPVFAANDTAKQGANVT